MIAHYKSVLCMYLIIRYKMLKRKTPSQNHQLQTEPENNCLIRSHLSPFDDVSSYYADEFHTQTSSFHPWPLWYWCLLKQLFLLCTCYWSRNISCLGSEGDWSDWCMQIVHCSPKQMIWKVCIFYLVWKRPETHFFYLGYYSKGLSHI